MDKTLLIDCLACGNSLSRKAFICPKCAHPQPRQQRATFFALIVPVIALIYAGYFWIDLSKRQASAKTQRISEFSRDLRTMKQKGASDRELCDLAQSIISDMIKLSPDQMKQSRAVIATYCTRGGI